MDTFDARRATLDLVTAFVKNNSLNAQELPTLLSDVYGAIAGFVDRKTDGVASADGSAVAQEAVVSAPAPETPARIDNEAPKVAVSIKESLADPDYIVSMITGEKMKTLARHLRLHGLDAQQYRERYNLPKDYPMVAPAYSEFRRGVAKRIALGRIGRVTPVAAASTSSIAVTTAPGKAEEKTSKVKPKAAAAVTAAPALPSASSAPKASAPARAVNAAEPAAASSPVVAMPADVTGPAGIAPAKKRGRPAGKSKTAKAVSVTLPAAAPSTKASGAAKMNAKTTVQASTALGKSDGAAVSSAKIRRGKLKPVFNG